MTATAQALRPPSRTLLLLEGRALQELGAFMLLRPWLAAAPRGDGHPVLVLPGLLASDFSTQPLRSFLKAQGYAVHGWKQGRNLGLRPGVEPDMLERVEELYDRHGGRKLSLVGWSLGGIYARQLAKLLPDKVRSVISLGSPFAGSPKATNAWKVYEFASGQSVEDRDGHIAGPLAEPPPVPTTSIFSRSDGICAWQTCVNEERAKSRTSRSMAAIAGSAIIRPPSLPSPTAWRSPKASGRSSTAPAGRASCFRTGAGLTRARRVTRACRRRAAVIPSAARDLSPAVAKGPALRSG